MESVLKDIVPLLPEDWREKARELKAIQRQRNLHTPEDLLTLNLLYVSVGGSYQAASEMMKLGAGIQLDKNAAYKRIQASGEWLQYLAESVCKSAGTLLPKPAFLENRQVILVDASELPVKGSKGGDYRLHYAFDLFGFACRDMRITTIEQGEKLSLHDVREGDIVEGDRIYGTINGMEYVRERKADFVLRLRRNAFKLYDDADKEVDVLAYTSGMKAYETREIRCFYHVKQDRKAVRIVIMKNDKAAIARAKRRMQRNASKKQLKPLSVEAEQLNEYLVVATSLEDSAKQIVELYRARWQIEMVFLRLKELFGIGEIPNKRPSSVKAWFYGKLLLAAICEAQMRLYSFPPSTVLPAQSQCME